MKRYQFYRLYAVGMIAAMSLAQPPQLAAAGKQSVMQTEKTLTVKGQVVDYLNEPLIGVTVQIVGQQGGTVTDFDGN